MRAPWLLCALAVTGAAQADDAPFAVRDQNPLLRAVYLPVAPLAGEPTEGLSASAVLDWHNTVNLQSTARESLTVDEETAELDLGLTRAAGATRLRATLPVLTRGSGMLDGPIDDWHRFFGLPRGDRPLRAHDAYALRYTAPGVALDVPQGTALGDLALEAERALATGRERLALGAGLTLPTGSRRLATSDGALDLAAWVAGGVDLGERAALDLRAAVSHPGGNPGFPVARAVGLGTAALRVGVSARLDAVLELDAHSRVARDSALPFLGPAVILSFGGRYRLASGARLEFAVMEDIDVNHSPDVTFHVAYRCPPAGAAR